jgi:hypothetical protein
MHRRIDFSESIEDIVLVPDQDMFDPAMELDGEGYLKKERIEGDPNEDDAWGVNHLISRERSNVTVKNPVHIYGIYENRGGSFCSEDHIRLFNAHSVSMFASKTRRKVRMNAEEDEDEVNVPHLNLGQIGNDCYDLPHDLYMDFSALEDVDSSVYEEEPWIEAENLSNCDEWRGKANVNLYENARHEWICKAIKMSESGSVSASGLFLVEKAKINPVDPGKETATAGVGTNIGNKPDDKNSNGLIIGIAVGISGIVAGVVIGVVVYCRSKSRRESSDYSVESYSEEGIDSKRLSNSRRDPKPDRSQPVTTSLPVSPSSYEYVCTPGPSMVVPGAVDPNAIQPALSENTSNFKIYV